MRALRKEPRERYGSVAALAADLRAWLDRRPMTVSPARTGWRVERAFVAGPAFALLTCAGLLGWQVFAMRAERDAARARLADAERALRAAQAVAEEAARRPPVVDLRLEIARTTSDLALVERGRGDLAKAETLWTQALSDLKPVLDAGPGDVRVLEAVAGVRASLGSVCRSQRRFEESLAHYREALRSRERAASAPGAPSGAALALGDARTSVARLLLDLVEVRQRGPNDAARLREAGALLAQAGPAARAAAASPSQQETVAEVDRQSARLRRIANERQ